jgi:hypothetical protein
MKVQDLQGKTKNDMTAAIKKAKRAELEELSLSFIDAKAEDTQLIIKLRHEKSVIRRKFEALTKSFEIGMKKACSIK